MVVDPLLTQEARAWMIKAHADLRAADHDLSADPPLAGDALFHC